MTTIQKEVLVVGGGPAGLAAALRLHQQGVRDIVVLEREAEPGGILRQCIHDGFGLTRFGQSLSGPEYAAWFIEQARQAGIEIIPNTTVTGLSPERMVTAVSQKGLCQYQAKAVVLAMGCRERTRGALGIPGARPAGVYTAGVAQSYVNLLNTMPGKNIIILGSGDIGLIMARRFTLEGAKVHAVFEILPSPSGLPRNVEQCLNDYGIPLYLSHTVTCIHGKGRVEGVTVSQVTADTLCPVAGTERVYPCDTLVLSVGLIPENELSLMAGVELDKSTSGAIVDENYQTSVPGIFAAGNVLHVHDLVDFVSLEAEALAEGVQRYLSRKGGETASIRVVSSGEIGHVVPHMVSARRDFTLSLRVRQPWKNCTVLLSQNGREVLRKKMQKALPAEMIQLNVKAQQLQPEGDLEVWVE